jgi:UDP-glucose 4-epimerase
MKKILVTGGAGFIGSHVVDLLEEGGHELLVVDNLSTGRLENLRPEAKVIKKDLCRPDSADAVVGTFCPDVVVHLAAQVNVRRSIQDPSSDAELNILAGVRLFEACSRYRVRRVILASSGGAIYGDQDSFPIPESATPNPKSPYGLAKQALEEYGRYFSRTVGSDFVVLRLANVYGPRQNPQGEAGVVAIFLDSMRRGLAPVVYGDGQHTRDYVWVGDVARAFAAALDGPAGTYNVGTGLETQTLEMFRHLRGVMSFDLSPQFVPEVRGEVRRNSLNCSLARQALNWEPQVTLDFGIQRLVDSLRSAKLA